MEGFYMTTLRIDILKNYTKEHNKAMINLVENILKEGVKNNDPNVPNVYCCYVAKVPKDIAEIFIALSNADCLYAEILNETP